MGIGSSSDPLADVAQDATSLIYVPESAAQWDTVLSVAEVSSGGPSSLYLCQEASGNLADSIGANTLTLSGAGHLFRQTVTGWARKAATTTNGTAGQKWINSTTSPNPNTVSILLYAILRLPAAAPAAARDVMLKANNADLRFNTTGKLRLQAGASVDLVNVSTNTIQPVVLQTNISASTVKVFTRQEKLTGTFALPTSGNILAIGGQSAAAADCGYLSLVEFSDAAAEMSESDIHSMLTTLGWELLWIP